LASPGSLADKRRNDSSPDPDTPPLDDSPAEHVDVGRERERSDGGRRKKPTRVVGRKSAGRFEKIRFSHGIVRLGHGEGGRRRALP
jgi:hypothetical protein